MGLDDRDFDQVTPGTRMACRCSPDLGDRAFRGIRLAAPRQVRFHPGEIADPFQGGFARVIVCGAFRFDAGYLDLGQEFLPFIVLVAVDASTHRASSATMMPAFGGLDDAPLPPAALAGRVIGGYFNQNLAALLDLPEADADYLVHATLGEYVSNVVRIEVRAHA